MKNKFLSGVLISLAFPVCGSAAPVTGDSLDISSVPGANSVAAGTFSGTVGDGNEIDAFSTGAFSNGAYNTISKSDGGVALGGYNVSGQDNYSLVAGFSNTISTSVNQRGTGNILLGALNTLNKATSTSDVFSTILLGNGNSASTSRAWVIGQGNIGQTDTVTLGRYAATVEGASLIVGRGTADNARTNGLVVLNSGVVQIPGSLEIGGVDALTTSTVNAHLNSNGYLNRVTGDGASATAGALLAVGPFAYAGNTRSIAFGYQSQSTGADSVAIGWNAQASGLRSVSLRGLAGGAYSFAASGGTANGDRSVALGFGQGLGKSSVGIGNYSGPAVTWSNMAYGDNATSIGGIRNLANGFASYALGTFIETNSAHSIALGSLNKGTSTSSTDWVQTDPLFELGNGYSSDFLASPIPSALRSNAITTLKNGRTTLTNKFWVSTTPEVVPAATDASAGEALAVEGHAKVKGNATIDGTTTLNGKVILAEAQGDISMGIYE